MAAKVERVTLEVAGREVSVSNPGKLYFPEAGLTKLELVQY
jgi:DNA primase